MTRTAADTRRPGRLLVVAARSFIARHFLATCDEPLTAVNHEAIDRADLLDGVDRVISFARHPSAAPPAIRSEKQRFMDRH